jgi:DNA-binding MarR family transcriptional regulator
MKNNKMSYGKLNDLNLDVFVGLNRVTQAIQRRSNTILSATGLTTTQFAVLEVLYHKGDLRICEIIDKILATSGNMTVVINNLAKEHLIEKVSDPNDKRATLIKITEKGRGEIEKIFPEHLLDLEEYFSTLTVEEKSQLKQILIKLGRK